MYSFSLHLNMYRYHSVTTEPSARFTFVIEKKSTSMKILLNVFLISILGISSVYAQIQNMGLVNEPSDISSDFYDFKNTYYFADSLSAFNPDKAEGTINYKRYEYKNTLCI